VTFNSITLGGGYSSGSGGSIYVNAIPVTINFNGSRAINNYSGNSGGFASGGIWTLNNSLFIENNSNDNLTFTSSSGSINNSTFIDAIFSGAGWHRCRSFLAGVNCRIGV
jgi:hypothetical protein